MARGRRRQCPQPRASAPVPAQRPARLRQLRRRLRHHRPGPLRLRDATRAREPARNTPHASTAPELEGRVPRRAQGAPDGARAGRGVRRGIPGRAAPPATSRPPRRADELRRALADVERKIAGIVRAIEDGNYNPTLTKRLSALEAEKAERRSEAGVHSTAPTIELHPNLPELYRRQGRAARRGAGRARDARRGRRGHPLAHHPHRADAAWRATLEVRLYGDLAEIVAFSQSREKAKRKAPPRARQGHYCRWLRGEDLNL